MKCNTRLKWVNRNLYLPHSSQRSLSYTNQSIDLLSKSMDWFIYERDLRHERVKKYLAQN